MKKPLRLTESDLARLVEKIISEQSISGIESKKNEVVSLIKKVISSFKNTENSLKSRKVEVGEQSTTTNDCVDYKLLVSIYSKLCASHLLKVTELNIELLTASDFNSKISIANKQLEQIKGAMESLAKIAEYSNK